MPQLPPRIPLESSQTLAFTPECLKHLDTPPVFHLRAATWREKDARLYLSKSNGLAQHGEKAMRAEVLNGLKSYWTPEQFNEFGQVFTAYWEDMDNFVLQKKDDPDLVWEYDADIERQIRETRNEMEKTWRPLATMVADNDRHDRLAYALDISVLVKSFDGLNTKLERDGEYLAIGCVIEVAEEMHQRWGVDAFGELYTACFERLYLSEAEAGNSASPSPSRTNPPHSTEKTSGSAGKSPASARSRKTRKAA